MQTVAEEQTVIVDEEIVQRECTRCDGVQHLVNAAFGMGKYVCDTCSMIVGFDKQASPPEFLIHRGLPKDYTKDVFGTRLMPVELESRTSS